MLRARDEPGDALPRPTAVDDACSRAASRRQGAEQPERHRRCRRRRGLRFTDPSYGRMGVLRRACASRSSSCSQGVYQDRRRQRAASVLLGDDFGAAERPVLLGSTSRGLFVNDTERQHIRVFNVKGNGDLGGGALLGGDRRRRPGALPTA